MKNLMKVLGAMFILSLLAFKVQAESFSWPSTGYIGYRYYSESGHSWDIGGKYHTGLDIWSNKNGDWNNIENQTSNGIYPAYSGTVQQIYGTPGILIKHSDNLYTKYWHIKDIKVSLNQQVDTNTLLGYQTKADAVHVHLTIATAPGNSDADNTVDPSSYYGLQLNASKPNSVDWLYPVIRSSPNSCGGANVTISNYNYSGVWDCAATSSITIMPESNLSGELKFYIN